MKLCFSILSNSAISGPLLHAVEHPDENLQKQKILNHKYS